MTTNWEIQHWTINEVYNKILKFIGIFFLLTKKFLTDFSAG